MGELNVEGATNAWKETGNGRPQSDVTNPSLAVARPAPVAARPAGPLAVAGPDARAAALSRL